MDDVDHEDLCRLRATRALTSARVVWSRIRAVASRTSFIARRTPQVGSSTHSTHFMYAVSLTHGHRRQRPVEHPNHLAEGDLGRRAAQEVAAALPFLALHHAVALQLEQDRFQELLRDRFAAGQRRDQDRPVSRFPGEDSSAFRPYFDFRDSTALSLSHL